MYTCEFRNNKPTFPEAFQHALKYYQGKIAAQQGSPLGDQPGRQSSDQTNDLLGDNPKAAIKVVSEDRE